MESLRRQEEEMGIKDPDVSSVSGRSLWTSFMTVMNTVSHLLKRRRRSQSGKDGRFGTTEKPFVNENVRSLMTLVW